MRVITGKYKGRKLESPPDRATRPTSDKVKEAVFDILMQEIPGSVVCDLFAGSGALGIEALSRGAKRCYFGDSSRDAVRLIHRNLKHCGAEEAAEVFLGDYSRVLSRLPEPVDVFLIDPPYRAGLYEDCFKKIASLDLLAPQGIIIAEHETRAQLPEELSAFRLVKSRKYGKTSLSLYQRKGTSENVKEGCAPEGREV